MRQDWIWMPHAGHYIMGNYCRFHLSTYINGFIISTVGDLWPEEGVRRIHAKIFDPKWYEKNETLVGDFFDVAYMQKFGYGDVSCSIKFETMVFKAKKSKCSCCPYKMSNSKNIDFCGYNDEGEAVLGHYKMCEKYDTYPGKQKNVNKNMKKGGQNGR